MQTFNAPPEVTGQLLVVFEDVAVEPESSESAPTLSGLPPHQPKNRIFELEKELQYTRESHQTTIEELESSNEELQSTNEELESSKEELQSLNEELQTVNSEMQNKGWIMSPSRPAIGLSTSGKVSPKCLALNARRRALSSTESVFELLFG